MIIDLPFPHKILWPNGRGHHFAVAREVKKHRQWARIATQAALGRADAFMPTAIKLVVHPKAKGPFPDKDNCIAACKSMLDGIADALAVNDAGFPAPTVEMSFKREGRFVVILSPPLSIYTNENSASDASDVLNESGPQQRDNAATGLTFNVLSKRNV